MKIIHILITFFPHCLLPDPQNSATGSNFNFWDISLFTGANYSFRRGGLNYAILKTPQKNLDFFKSIGLIFLEQF